jgi:hypothetical protein
MAAVGSRRCPDPTHPEGAWGAAQAFGILFAPVTLLILLS